MAQWEGQHVEVRQLPIGLLQDLSRFSRHGQTVSETLARLLHYEEEYYRYLGDLRDRFVRILNLQRITADLARLSPGEDVSHNLQELVRQLDEAVYHGPFLVDENMRDHRLQEALVLDHDGHQIEATLDFQVVIMYTDVGRPIAYYEYLGQQIA